MAKMKYSAMVIKDHQITIRMESLNVAGKALVSTEYDFKMQRHAGSTYGFKTLKGRAAWIEAGNKECPGAYIPVQGEFIS